MNDTELQDDLFRVHLSDLRLQGYTLREIAGMEGLSVYQVRKLLAEHKRNIEKEEEVWLHKREYHEQWRDYGEGVHVRWMGTLRISIIACETTGTYRYYLKCEERRLFDSSPYVFESLEECKRVAERNAKAHYPHLVTPGLR